MKESTPLKWPEGWPRTDPREQKEQRAWKHPRTFYVAALEKELKRMGVTSFALTRNEDSERDPGVAAWFSRKKKDDFSWKTTLGIASAYPTEDEIDRAYKSLAKKYHPEGSSPDIELFRRATQARDAGFDWANRREDVRHDYAIACDAFTQVRHNIAGLAALVRHIRGLERLGGAGMVERTFQGFAQIPEKAETHVVTASA